MNPSNLHFDEEQWADFVRGTASDSNSAAMRAHLDSGCARCARTVSLFSSLSAFAAAESLITVPPGLTAAARQIFQPSPSASWAESLPALIASLVWENQPGSAPLGVRSQSEGAQRLVYRAGSYSVDIKLDRPAGEAGEIIGQISSEENSLENLDGILVQVVSTGQTLVETATNRFGEFIIEFPAAKKSLLRFALRQPGCRIDLPLNG